MVTRGRRRSEPDPLAPTKEPTWLAVWGPFRDLLQSQPLEPYTDLRAALNAERDSRIAAGWKADPIGPRSGFFFCDKDRLRVMVIIQRVDPSRPLPMR